MLATLIGLAILAVVILGPLWIIAIALSAAEFIDDDDGHGGAA